MGELAQVGSKALDLLAQLAEKIGVTVKELYPCIEKQVQLEGTIALWAAGIIIVIAISLTISGILVVNKNEDMGIPFIAIGVIIIVISIAVAGSELSSSITKIKNPKYHAVQRIINMAGKLK